MKKQNIIGITVVLVAVAGVILYAKMGPIPGGAPVGASGAGITLPMDGYSEHTQYYDISASYATSTPLLESAGAMADATARSQMYGFIRDTIATFKTEGNFTNLSSQDIAAMRGGKEKLNIVYLIGSSAHTVSYIFTVYEDTLGAHGNTSFHTFTFDSKTGKLLSLADVFSPGTSYLTTLSTIARTKLPDIIGPQGADSTLIANGTTPDEKNFANFFFDNQDFVILFAPYAVAPYASGPQTLRISLSELSSVLKPDFR